MYTVLEDQPLVLRSSKDPETGTKNEGGNVERTVILANAARTEEDYFVAPPGNVPLKIQTAKYK